MKCFYKLVLICSVLEHTAHTGLRVTRLILTHDLTCVAVEERSAG